MNLDVKSILILMLLIISLFLGYNWYFGNTSNSDYKKQVKKLREENKKLKIDRDSLSLNINKLEDDFKKIKESEDSLLIKIEISKSEILELNRGANVSKNELAKLRKELYEINKRIKEFNDNPPNRVGDDLINSIKNKTKR